MSLNHLSHITFNKRPDHHLRTSIMIAPAGNTCWGYFCSHCDGAPREAQPASPCLASALSPPASRSGRVRAPISGFSPARRPQEMAGSLAGRSADLCAIWMRAGSAGERFPSDRRGAAVTHSTLRLTLMFIGRHFSAFGGIDRRPAGRTANSITGEDGAAETEHCPKATSEASLRNRVPLLTKCV